ncbi:hypothetical protein AVEN_108120-1 [Araneus ventricosus]|uniref:Uncharacterized protein n=1 Tax=Araneus ventricosus TaxID=182803 RepID=A0A4Y2H5Q2_ARAVE|nr:hypothetical protein AVEN_108120-1 [Araneus ventricosus]
MYKLSIYYLCKGYETTGSIENKRGRDRKPKTSTREDSVNVRFSQKKNDISSREIVKDLKFNASALTVCLIIKNSGSISCVQRKGQIHLKTKHGNDLGLCKRAYFECFTILGQCVLWSYKSKYDLFGSEKRKRVWGRPGEALKS